jgi:hypothetical protein
MASRRGRWLDKLLLYHRRSFLALPVVVRVGYRCANICIHAQAVGRQPEQTRDGGCHVRDITIPSRELALMGTHLNFLSLRVDAGRRGSHTGPVYVTRPVRWPTLPETLTAGGHLTTYRHPRRPPSFGRTPQLTPQPVRSTPNDVGRTRAVAKVQLTGVKRIRAEAVDEWNPLTERKLRFGLNP